MTCVQHQAAPGRPVLLLLGDSVARALTPGLAQQAARDDSTLVQAAWQRCSPTGLLVVPNGLTAPDVAGLACARQARPAISSALATYRPQRVLVTEYWSHHQSLLVDGEVLAPGSAAHTSALERAYLALVEEIGRALARVVLVELPPPGLSIGPSVAAGRPAGSATPAPGGAYVEGFNRMLREVARQRPDVATTVDVSDVLCPDGSCAAVQHGRVVRGDGVHVTAAFSRVLAPVLLRRVDLALSAQAAAPDSR